LTFTIPAAAVGGQGGFLADIDNAYAALAVAVGVNVLNTAYAGGADPTGVADSTAALAAAKAAALSSGRPLCIPAGTYKISAKLDWTGDGLTIIADGAARTSIIQATANTGVVQVAGYAQRISGLTLGYATQRPAAETNSICLGIGKNATSTWMGRYSDLFLQNGQTLLGRDPGCTGSVPLFNCYLSNILLESWTQSAIHLDSPAGECTGCQFDNIYVSNSPAGIIPGGASAGPPIVLDSWTESVWNNLTVGGASLSTSLIFVANFENLTFNSTHTEGNAYGTSGTAIFEVGGSRVSALVVNGLTQQSDVIAAGVTVSAVAFTGAGWGKSAIVNGWVNESLSMGAGASLYFANFAAAGLCRAWLKTSELSYQGVAPALSTGGNSGSPCYAAWNSLPVGALGPPAVPATTVAYLNAYKCHAQVYVTAGAAATTVAVDGTTMAVLPAGAVCSFHVPGGSTITLTYTSGTPSWKWYGAAS
jgi:hypothetical protein